MHFMNCLFNAGGMNIWSVAPCFFASGIHTDFENYLLIHVGFWEGPECLCVKSYYSVWPVFEALLWDLSSIVKLYLSCLSGSSLNPNRFSNYLNQHRSLCGCALQEVRRTRWPFLSRAKHSWSMHPGVPLIYFHKRHASCISHHISKTLGLWYSCWFHFPNHPVPRNLYQEVPSLSDMGRVSH